MILCPSNVKIFIVFKFGHEKMGLTAITKTVILFDIGHIQVVECIFVEYKRCTIITAYYLNALYEFSIMVNLRDLAIGILRDFEVVIVQKRG